MFRSMTIQVHLPSLVGDSEAEEDISVQVLDRVQVGDRLPLGRAVVHRLP